MQSITNELDTKESVTKLPRNKKSAPSDQLSSSNNEIGRQQKIAIVAYYKAEKRGFTGSEVDAVQDWLEAEKEVEN